MISKLAPAITAIGEEFIVTQIFQHLFIADLTKREGIDHQLEVEEMDDETYTGMLIYKPWGDYTEKPMMSC